LPAILSFSFPVFLSVFSPKLFVSFFRIILSLFSLNFLLSSFLFVLLYFLCLSASSLYFFFISRFTASLSVFVLIFSFLISFHLPFIAASDSTLILPVLKSSFGGFPCHAVHCCPNP
jgi:hypothetical protein